MTCGQWIWISVIFLFLVSRFDATFVLLARSSALWILSDALGTVPLTFGVETLGDFRRLSVAGFSLLVEFIGLPHGIVLRKQERIMAENWPRLHGLWHALRFFVLASSDILGIGIQQEVSADGLRWDWLVVDGATYSILVSRIRMADISKRSR